MIRFVYIGEQIIDGNQNFAWYDTITDEFISFNGQMIFDSWEDFEKAHELEKADAWMGEHTDIERFRSLFPKQEYDLGIL